MRVLRLPRVTELGDRSRLADGNEDRVIAEPLVAAPRVGDASLEGSGRAQLGAVRRERDQLAYIARMAFRLPVELDEKLRDTVLRPAGGVHARAPVQRCHLDPRVLAGDPGVGRRVQSTMASLDPCVLEER